MTLDKNDSILVRVKHLTKRFDVSEPWLTRLVNHSPKMTLTAVDDVSFDIHRGEILSLVGESGCGKSTTAKLLCGLYEPSFGTVTVDGIDLATLNEKNAPLAKSLRRRINMIFQDPYASLNPRWRVRDIIAEPIRVQKLLTDEKAINDRVNELMTLVKLNPQDAEKYRSGAQVLSPVLEETGAQAPHGLEPVPAFGAAGQMLLDGRLLLA